MPDARPLPSVISQFALACNLTSLFLLLTLSDGPCGIFYPWIMLLYAPLIYILNRLFLRQERTMLTLTILNGSLLSPILAGYLILNPWRSFAEFVFAAGFLIWLTVRGCNFARNGPPLRSTLLTLDCSFLLLIAFIGCSAAMNWSAHWAIPAVCGIAASILAAAASRLPVARNSKSRFSVAAVFVALFGLMWFFVEVLAVPAGSGLVLLWNWIISGINWGKQLLFAFLLYLLSLFPNTDPGELLPHEIPDFSQQMESVETKSSPILGAFLFAVLILCAAALFIWLIRKLRNIRLRSPVKATPTIPLHRNRISFLQGFLHLLSACISGIRLRICLWNGRNTASGLYFLLVHRCRRSPWRKHPSETPREFLLRMANTVRADVELSSALEQLAWDVNAAFYAPHPILSQPKYAPMIRRRIGTAVVKQLFRDTAVKLKSGIKRHPDKGGSNN